MCTQLNRRYDKGLMFENVPRHVKLMYLVAIVAIGPILAIAAMFGGFNAVVPTVAVLFVGGIISYVVTVRKYTKD